MRVNFEKIIKGLLGRSVITISLLLFSRIVTFLPIPGINHKDLAFYAQTHSVTKTLATKILGEETLIIGLCALSIYPYINASILVQLLVANSPELMEQTKDGSLESRRKIQHLTRLIGIICGILQSILLTTYLRQILFNWNYILAFKIIIWLTTGGMIILWFAEIVTDYGLGNGISFFICISIAVNGKTSLFPINQQLSLSDIITLSLVTMSLYGLAFFQKGARHIELISSKDLNGNLEIAKNQSYIPVRYNSSGVLPILFASNLVAVPNSFLSSSVPDSPVLGLLYWFIYFMTIFSISLFYSRLNVSPRDIGKNLQARAVTILGIRPGRSTVLYLQETVNRVTLVGSTGLAILVTLPSFAEYVLNSTTLNGFSISSLLILQSALIELEIEVKDIKYSNMY